jgi:hypothetical protein
MLVTPEMAAEHDQDGHATPAVQVRQVPSGLFAHELLTPDQGLLAGVDPYNKVGGEIVPDCGRF